jgi:hypothetical protein
VLVNYLIVYRLVKADITAEEFEETAKLALAPV